MNEAGRPVTDQQWAALGLVIARSDGARPTYIVTAPEGDAAISTRTATALSDRGLITIELGPLMAWPTAEGRRAYAAFCRRSS